MKSNTMQRLLASTLMLAAASAQGFLYLPATLSPDTTELSTYNLRPFMQTNARVQMFFSATETGSSSFTANAISMRYDGPIPQVGAPGPFTVQRLRVHIGASAVDQPTATFSTNLTQPLTTVYDAPFSYLPDPGSAFPHPWAVPGTSLRIPFQAPVSVAIPAGGWFVVEIQMEGNNIANFGFSHAIVDGHTAPGGAAGGTATSFGQGCSASVGAPGASIGSTGVHAPGAAHFVSGQHLGANSLALLLLSGSNTTSQLGALPWNLPGTACDLYTDLDLNFVMFTDANGAIAPNQQMGAISVPANTAFNGVNIYEQFASLVAGANAWDIVLSDARAITLGTFTTPAMGVYSVSHGSNASAGVGDKVEAFGYALRVETN